MQTNVCVAVFCAFYIFHGLLKELKYEIYMFIYAAAFVLLYCIIEYILKPSHRSEIKLVMFVTFQKLSCLLK